MTEVRLGGGLDAVGAAPEVHRVEVGVEDLLLGLGAVDLEGEDRLLELARVGGGGVHVVVLDVLLGEGGGALGVAAAEVVPQGTQDALGIHPVVGVEGGVLGGHDGVAHVVRQRGGVDDGAVDLGEVAHLRGAVRIVDRGGLRLGELVGAGDVDDGVGHDEQSHQRGDEGEEAAQEEAPAGDPAHDPALAGARVVEEPTASGGGRLVLASLAPAGRAAPAGDPGGLGGLAGLGRLAGRLGGLTGLAGARGLRQLLAGGSTGGTLVGAPSHVRLDSFGVGTDEGSRRARSAPGRWYGRCC